MPAFLPRTHRFLYQRCPRISSDPGFRRTAGTSEPGCASASADVLPRRADQPGHWVLRHCLVVLMRSWVWGFLVWAILASEGLRR